MRHASKALIKVGYACNNRCVFCHTRHEGLRAASSASIEAKINLAAERGATMVVFSGGEPTLRPELEKWAACCARRGVSMGLVTNGRMLSYRALTAGLVDRGLRYAHVSLHGPAAVHDEMVGVAGAFAQSWAGIETLSRQPSVELAVNTVVTRKNLAELEAVVELVAGLGREVELKLSFVEAKGAARDDFEAVVPSVREAGARIGEVITFGRRMAPHVRYAHEGVALCCVPRTVVALGSGLSGHGFAIMSEADEEGFYPVDDLNKTHPPVCEGCAERARCPGLFTVYLERVGADELRPFSIGENASHPKRSA